MQDPTHYPLQDPAYRYTPFTIYRSSAGSGKTYTLAREYLAMALRSPGYYQNILAVTFTNKATREMKERIVENLAALAKGEDHPMLPELMAATKLNAPKLRTRARLVLTHLLHHYAFFFSKHH